MWPTSLRMRLLVGAAVSIAAALLVAGLFLIASFAASIEGERRNDLQASLDRIIAAIDPDASALITEGPLTDPRYETPLGGVYWQVEDRDTGKVLRSRSLWDLQLPASTAQQTSPLITQVSGPGGKPLIVLAQTISVESTKGVRRFGVAVAEERSTDDDPITHFGRNLLLALLLLGAALVTAAALQVHYGLLPLTALRRDINAVRNGAASRLPDKHTGELMPVTRQINELLDAQDDSITFARERAADLAHGLKTPLAILSATADRVRDNGDRENGDVLRMLTDQMNSRIDYQLRIARLRYRTRALGVTASINEVVLRSLAVIRRGHLGERLNWIAELEPDLVVDMDQHDLMELTGILLENASQWAHERVAVRGYRRDAWAMLVIEDDGIGLTDEQVARLGVRGTRLDESADDGDGLGLAIAFEIARLNRGSIEATRSPLGGLHVCCALPMASTSEKLTPRSASRVKV